MVDRVYNLVHEIIREIRNLTSKQMVQGYIDAYTEQPYDEPNQKHIIELSFNEGDDRTLEITLDIEPDV